MAGEPDIYLQQNRTVVVDTLHGTTERGHDDGPDLRFLPNWAALHLGGGGGENSDGDLLLHERPEDGEGSVRVHLSGGKGGQRSSTRVFMDGHHGSVEVGREGGGIDDEGQDSGDVVVYDTDGEPTVHLMGGDQAAKEEYYDAGVRVGPESRISLGGGLDEDEPGIVADGRLPVGGGEPGGDDVPTLYLAGPRELYDGDPGLLLNKGLKTVGWLSVEGEESELNLGFRAEDTGITGSIDVMNESGTTFDVDGAAGSVTVGGNADGAVTVADDQGVTTVDVTGSVRGGGGAVSVSDDEGNTTVELRGDQGEVVTGGDGTSGGITIRDVNGGVSGFIKSDGDDIVISVPDGNSEPVAIRIHSDGAVSFPQGER